MESANLNGRRVDGTFAPGHRFSKGHKGNKRVAELRAALLDAVDAAALTRVVRKLVELAEGGDVPAARVVLEYAIGKPPQALELSGPDGGPLEADWTNIRVALLTALEGFPEARVSVAAALSRIALAAREDAWQAVQDGEGA